jgi:hypothetical protein
MDDPNYPWDLIAAIGACAAVVVAWYQIGAIERSQKGWETLKACEKYDSDPVLDVAIKTLRNARNSGALISQPQHYTLEATSILNYLEGIAIGVRQGFYNEKIVKDHLEQIIKFHIRECSVPPLGPLMDIKYFDNLVKMIADWRVGKRFKRRFYTMPGPKI